jgi:hypothetical protein
MFLESVFLLKNTDPFVFKITFFIKKKVKIIFYFNPNH